MARLNCLRPLLTPPNDGTQKENRLDLRVALKTGAGQMRWSKRGAHLMLQTRTRVLDGTLRTKFEQWHPALKSSPETGMAA